MKRGTMKVAMDALKVVERALEGLPYREALPAMKELDGVRACIAEELPGHEYAECAFCEEAKGIDEMVEAGDELMCSECMKRAEAA